MTSGVSRHRVRSRRRWRITSCPAAKPMRWVNPSMARVSPSRTSSATASPMLATLSSATDHLGGGGLLLGQGEAGGDLLDRLGEQPQGGAALVGGDDQGRGEGDGALPRPKEQ